MFKKTDSVTKKKILLLGASGFIGSYLFKKLGAIQTIGTYSSNKFESGVFFDSLNMPLASIIKNPEEISHAVIFLGVVRPDLCYQNKTQTQKINVDSIIKILKQLKSWNIKPVYASSESIFDGEKGNYCEDDTPNPILVYGQQKVQVENFIRDNFKEYVILRIATVVGNNSEDGTILSSWFNQVMNCKDIKSATDQIKSPIFIDDLTTAIKKIINKDISGVFNAGGTKSYSSYGLSKIILEEVKRVKKIENKVIGVSINDFKTEEKRPHNVSMDSSKLWNKIDIKPKNMDIICQELVGSYFKK